MFADTKQDLEERTKELEETGKTLEQTTKNLHVTTGKLQVMTQDRDEQKHLVGVQINTEQKLHSQATQVLQLFMLFTLKLFNVYTIHCLLVVVTGANWNI